MRSIDRILRRETAERPSYAVRAFGTTAAEAEATDAAAAAVAGDGGTSPNLTTGGTRTREFDDGFDRGNRR